MSSDDFDYDFNQDKPTYKHPQDDARAYVEERKRKLAKYLKQAKTAQARMEHATKHRAKIDSVKK